MKNKWIEVNEKLPDKFTKVLVHSSSLGVIIAWIDEDGKWDTNEIDEYEGAPDYGLHATQSVYNVTHWKELDYPKGFEEIHSKKTEPSF